MTDHPGRMALLSRAAYTPGLGDEEVARLIRYGAPVWPPGDVVELLGRARAALADRKGYMASAILNSLLEPPPEEDTPG